MCECSATKGRAWVSSWKLHKMALHLSTVGGTAFLPPPPPAAQRKTLSLQFQAPPGSMSGVNKVPALSSLVVVGELTLPHSQGRQKWPREQTDSLELG